MNAYMISKIEYRPVRASVKTSKKGKKTLREGQFVIFGKAEKWETISAYISIADDNLASFTGTFTADAVKVAIYNLYNLLALDAHPAVKTAKEEAEKRLAEKAEKKVERERIWASRGLEAIKKDGARRGEASAEKKYQRIAAEIAEDDAAANA